VLRARAAFTELGGIEYAADLAMTLTRPTADEDATARATLRIEPARDATVCCCLATRAAWWQPTGPSFRSTSTVHLRSALAHPDRVCNAPSSAGVDGPACWGGFHKGHYRALETAEIAVVPPTRYL
jgi:hypothetical protein